MTRYEELKEKELEDLTPEEKKYIIATEIIYYSKKVNQLRKMNVPDYKIRAYLHDLYNDDIIFDDAALADAYDISNDDDIWFKCLEYYWCDMEEDNPLRD